MREFLGEWTMGPFHCFPFRLERCGDSTILHAHKNDHLSRSDKRTAVYALMPDGAERLDEVGAFEWRLIKAGIEHLVLALEDGAQCECLFSKYDENGCYLADPKNLVKRPAYRDDAIVELPELVKQLLAREGISRQPRPHPVYAIPKY